MINENQHQNYDIFRDCFSTILIERITRQDNSLKNKRRGRKTKAAPPKEKPDRAALEKPKDPDGLGSPEELADFVDFTTEQTFEYLPAELKTVQHYEWVKDDEMQARYQLPLTSADVADLMPVLDPAIEESLAAYGIVERLDDDHNINNTPTATTATKNKHKPARNPQGLLEVLAPVLSAFITAISTPPPAPISTKQAAQEAGCEMCGRDWVPLTYHHLIPRFVHDKVVRRGWHREEDLQSVAWLCGACHRFVHRFAGHEELARHYYTVELLMQEESIVRWADWVGRLRWKGR
ncbi:5-methylcytosine-specific restriction enzyme A [Microdochium nivale]|nr:5-methylcytosine-specific restriction enzyme A [Microdochium nivale]